MLRLSTTRALRAAGRAIAIALLGTICTAAFASDENYNVEVAGANLHFRVRGSSRSNPYLLILHDGPGGNSLPYLHWGESLEDRFNVVYLDQRGCGQSARHPFANPMAPLRAETQAFTFERLLSDIEMVRRKLTIDHWFLLGHGFGAMLATEYASHFGASVLGVILVNPILTVQISEDSVLDATQLLCDSDLRSSDAIVRRDATLVIKHIATVRSLPVGAARYLESYGILRSKSIDLQFAKPSGARQLFDATNSSARSYGYKPIELVNALEPEISLLLNDNLAKRDVRAEAATLNCKMLVVTGKRDAASTPNQTISLVEKSGCRIVQFDGSGHFPFIEQPQALTKAIVGFLESQAH